MSETSPAGQGRRRVRSPTPRRCQIVVRFSTDELAAVRAAADQDGLAVGAWLGDQATRAHTDDHSVGLAELLRLHADITALTTTTNDPDEVGRLLARIDAVIDTLVTGRPG